MGEMLVHKRGTTFHAAAMANLYSVVSLVAMGSSSLTRTKGIALPGHVQQNNCPTLGGHRFFSIK